MKAQDLRIGNYVEHHKEVVRIVGITEENPYIDTITIDYLDWDEIEPIPLTEEWLLKFGFVKLGKLDFFYISEQEMNFKVSCDLKMIAWYNLQLHGVEIKHVHQLQNLYFALTNTEL